MMRTTVTLDEDVLRELRKIMRAEDKSFKQALNDTLRRGLKPGPAPGGKKRRFRVKPHNSPFRTGIDPAKLNQLADELDADAFLDRKRADGARGREGNRGRA